MTKLSSGIIVLLTPIIILFVTIQLLSSQFYLTYEYGRHNFPADKFGFTQEERLKLAKTGLLFLKSSENPEVAIQKLKDQSLPNSLKPLYNERELEHLTDVKYIFSTIIRLIVLSLLVASIAAAFLIKKKRKKEIIRSIFLGGMLTTTSTLLFLGLLVLSWDSFFLSFHELLFSPDTWTFYETDTLIRLYPEKFWFDFGLTTTVLILVQSIVITITGNLLYHHVKSKQIDSKFKQSMKKG